MNTKVLQMTGMIIALGALSITAAPSDVWIFSEPFEQIVKSSENMIREMQDNMKAFKNTIQSSNYNIHDEADTCVVTVFLPEIKKEDIKEVMLDKRKLSIFVHQENKEGLQERSYSILLPAGIDESKVDATWNEPVLKIVIGKKKVEVPSRNVITIK